MPQPRQNNRTNEEDENPRVGLSQCNHCKATLGSGQSHGYCRKCGRAIHMTMTCIECNQDQETVQPAQENTDPQSDETQDPENQDPENQDPENQDPENQDPETRPSPQIKFELE